MKNKFLIICIIILVISFSAFLFKIISISTLVKINTIYAIVFMLYSAKSKQRK